MFEERLLELTCAGYNCAQIVLQVVGFDVLGIEDGAFMQAMTGMNYGMHCQFTCGALVGGIAALSLHAKDKYDASELCKALGEWFNDKYGGHTCADILGEGMAPNAMCKIVAEETVEKCFELLEGRI